MNIFIILKRLQQTGIDRVPAGQFVHIGLRGGFGCSGRASFRASYAIAQYSENESYTASASPKL